MESRDLYGDVWISMIMYGTCMETRDLYGDVWNTMVVWILYGLL